MSKEIERKFFVKGQPWKGLSGCFLEQGYIADNGACVRVRTSAEKAWITVKGKTRGISRSEFEYEIPKHDAIAMLDLFCGKKRISKMRYKVTFEGSIWEIDVFEGQNKGLIIAEIELESEDQRFASPEWLGEEVSYDSRFFNINLLNNPWPWED